MMLPCRRWIEFEQQCLWYDLDNAIRDAINGVWSMRCDSLSVRLITSARLVGATPWGQIPWELSAGGVYQAMLDIAGVEPVLPADEAAWVQAESRMHECGGTRAEASARLAGTVSAIVKNRIWLSTEADSIA